MMFDLKVFKVTHCETKEVMVLKELYRLDEEAQKNFLKEVRFILDTKTFANSLFPTNWYYVFI